MVRMLFIFSKIFSLHWGEIGLCLILLLFTATVGWSAMLHLNGNWSTPFGDDDGPWILGQTYSLSVDQEVTSAINIGGNVRYTSQEQQANDKTTTLTPSLFFGISNDLFRFNLNGSQEARQKGSDPSTTTRSWTSSFSTNFPNKLWPQFRLSYGETDDSNDANPATIDSDSKSLTAGADYSWNFLKLLYNYTNSKNRDRISHSKSQTTGHSTNIQLTKELFEDRLSLRASHQYSINTTEATTTVIGGQIVVDLVASAAYAGIDNTPLTDPLPAMPTLNDQDFFTATPAQIPLVGDLLNLGLQINLQTFKRLQFYFDRLITTTTQNRLHWTFYTSMDNNNWSPLAATPALIYIEEDNRTVARIIFPTALVGFRYIKAVIAADPGPDTAFFTEILAQDEINSPEDTIRNDYTSETYQANINYRPWDSFQIGYSFNRNLTNSDRSPQSTQDNHTVSSHLNLNRFFMMSLSAGENTDKIEGQSDNVNRTYAVSYQTNPVDTITFSINGTRSDYYEAEDKVRTSNSISTTLATVIIPDLTANISYQNNKSEDYQDKSKTASDTYTINLTARINPRLNLSYYYNYNEISTHNASLLYHPSDLLSLTVSMMVTDNTQNYSTSAHYRLTRKVQTDIYFYYSMTDDENSYGSRFNINWDISSFLTLRQSLDWRKDSTDERWSGLISLSYNF